MLINCAAYQAGKKLADIQPQEIRGYLTRPECFVWMALKDPSETELMEMEAEFELHALAIEDARHGHQRPKIEEYDDDLFVVVHTLEFVGKEIVVVDDHRLSIRMDISGIGWTRTFLLSDITRFRAAGLFGPSDRWEYALAPWGFSGVIAFESHGKTRRFGSQLTEDQAYTLVERMKPCLPGSAWRTEPRPA